ncbi:hypothetical protein A6R68_07485, partial [Neotoma lepida]
MGNIDIRYGNVYSAIPQELGLTRCYKKHSI